MTSVSHIRHCCDYDVGGLGMLAGSFGMRRPEGDREIVERMLKVLDHELIVPTSIVPESRRRCRALGPVAPQRTKPLNWFSNKNT